MTSPPAAQGDVEGLHRHPDKRVGPEPHITVPGNCVVCARWCPTLPHPGGCSTIGAVRLSFRVRDGSGRFPVAVTTETTTWAVRQCSCDSVIRLPANTHTRMRMLCVWLVDWVGCGPYSGTISLSIKSPISPITIIHTITTSDLIKLLASLIYTLFQMMKL